MEVIIIGSGPAGICAAMAARKAGLRVLVFSKTVKLQREAEDALQSVHPGLEVLLKKIGLEKAIYLSSRSTYHTILSGITEKPLNSGEGEAWLGHHIERVVFDNYLNFSARRVGIEIRTDELIDMIHPQDDCVSVQMRSGKVFSADFLVDASGRSRVVSKKLKIESRPLTLPLFCWTGTAACVGSYGKIPTALNIDASGWTWTAPGMWGRYTWTRLSKQPSRPCSILLHDGNWQQVEYASRSNMQWSIVDPVPHPRILLAGDATGLLDPAASQGVFNACQSGIAAAEAIFLSKNEAGAKQAINNYGKWFTDAFTAKSIQLMDVYLSNGLDVRLASQYNPELNKSSTTLLSEKDV